MLHHHNYNGPQTLSAPPLQMYLHAWLQHRISQHVLTYELRFFGLHMFYFPTESPGEMGYAD